jgi:hypothetical protein
MLERLRKIAPLAAALVLAPLSGWAAEGSSGEAAAEQPHQVPRTEETIQVDGILDEPAWERALPLELGFETWPAENQPPPANTVCLFTYGGGHLYVGCRAGDPNPRKIRARFSDRDTAWSDDFVGIVIDTFNDERRAFEFFVNPLGVQMDLIQDDVNGREDSSWDAIWRSAGRVTEQGYEVEMAIPFSSLRFQRTQGDQIWGLDVVRIYPRDQRHRIGLHALDRNVACYLCQSSKIVGFEGAEPGKNLEVTPTFTASRTDAIDDYPDGDLVKEDDSAEPGLFVKWGFTPNMTLAGTLNPDFSQVEADVARLDVNEEFALFYPETRPFFLEGADFFESPVNAVYTRTVADPNWGARTTGKQGANGIGAFVVEDALTNLLFPGSQGSSLGSLDEESLAGVARYRHDVWKNSSVGGLVTARQSSDYHNFVYGADTQLRPTDRDRISVQLLASRTEYPDSIVEEYDQPSGEFSDRAFVLRYRHRTRNWSASASYEDFGEGFRADAGFVPRVDYRRPLIGGEYRWYGEEKHWWTQIGAGADWDQTEDQAGNLIERELEGWGWMNGPKQSFLWVGGGRRTRVFNEVSFPQDFVGAFFEITPTGDFSLFFDSDYGDRVDFSFAPEPGVARQGRQLDLRPGIRYNLGRHLKLNLTHSLRRLDLDQGRLFEADLTELRLVYQFNVRMFVRLITQYSKIDRDPSLYTDPVPAESEDLFNQLLFSYKVNSRTALYAGYSDEHANVFDDIETDSLAQTGRTFFAKIGYAWVP